MAGTVPSELPACTARRFLQTDSGQKAHQRCHTCSPVLPNSGDTRDQVGGARDAAQLPGHPHDRGQSSPKVGRPWSRTHLSLSQSLFQKHQIGDCFPPKTDHWLKAPAPLTSPHPPQALATPMSLPDPAYQGCCPEAPLRGQVSATSSSRKLSSQLL